MYSMARRKQFGGGGVSPKCLGGAPQVFRLAAAAAEFDGTMI